MFEITPFARTNAFVGAYDPFKEMEALEKRFFARQLPTFKTDIRKTENAYILDAELPGFSKEDITAEIKDGVLTLRAQKNTESEEKEEGFTYIRRERAYGSFSRSFNLEGIDSDGITATFKDGILSLTLPVQTKKTDEGRKLEIN